MLCSGKILVSFCAEYRERHYVERSPSRAWNNDGEAGKRRRAGAMAQKLIFSRGRIQTRRRNGHTFAIRETISGRTIARPSCASLLRKREQGGYMPGILITAGGGKTGDFIQTASRARVANTVILHEPLPIIVLHPCRAPSQKKSAASEFLRFLR